MTRGEYLEAIAHAADAREAAQRKLIRLMNEALVAGVPYDEVAETIKGAKLRRLVADQEQRRVVEQDAGELAREVAA